MRKSFNHASVSASFAFRTLGKHKMLSAMLILQCFLSIYLISVILQQDVFSQKEGVRKNEAFFLTQNLNGALYYGYQSNDDTYKNLMEFYDKLSTCDELTHYSVYATGIDICNDDIPENLLQDHLTFEYDEELLKQRRYYDKNGVRHSSVECTLISLNCLSDSDIYSGRLWREDDLEWRTGDEVPVILGYSFTDVYKVGDVFDATYSGEPITCCVLGFLKKDADIDIVNSNGDCGFTYNESVLFPALRVKDENINRFGKFIVLDRTGGYVESSIGFEKTNALVNSMLGESGIAAGGSGIYLHAQGIPDINVDIYKLMTDDVKQQFYLLLCFLVIFVILSITFTLNGFVRENNYSYGVMLLCGGDLFDIAFSVAVICLIIVGAAYLTVMYILILSQVGFMICTVISLLSAAIIVIACISPIRQISKYDISRIIGGKE